MVLYDIHTQSDIFFSFSTFFLLFALVFFESLGCFVYFFSFIISFLLKSSLVLYFLALNLAFFLFFLILIGSFIIYFRFFFLLDLFILTLLILLILNLISWLFLFLLFFLGFNFFYFLEEFFTGSIANVASHVDWLNLILQILHTLDVSQFWKSGCFSFKFFYG